MSDAVFVGIISFIGGIVVAVIGGGMSRQVKISEFRQAWINALREDIAAYLGATQRWFMKYVEGKDEKWKLDSMGNEASVILYRIILRLNPRDNNPTKKLDDEFIASLETIKNPYSFPRGSAEQNWGDAAQQILTNGRELLKREWNVTKGLPIIRWPWKK